MQREFSLPRLADMRAFGAGGGAASSPSSTSSLNLMASTAPSPAPATAGSGRSRRGGGAGAGAGSGLRESLLQDHDVETILLPRQQSSKVRLRRSHSIEQMHDHMQQASQFNSFDFEPCANEVNRRQFAQKSRAAFKRTSVMRWFLTFLIGVGTALVAVVITYCVGLLSGVKFSVVEKLISLETAKHVPAGIAGLVFVSFGMLFAFIAAMPVALWAPMAAGSGISEIKCLLNGVKIPKAVRFSTLVGKVFGVIFSVASGLPVGKEGPMIHSGAILGAGLSQGKSTSLNLKTKFLAFRNDVEKRDAVVCGAAAGVAAAFGAPIGGVLFALEEGASYWFQSLTWRSFFAAVVSTYVLDIFLSGINSPHHWGDLSEPGMFTFGAFHNSSTSYHFYEVPIFVLMGIAGGLIGAVFNALNKRLTIYRNRHLATKWRRLFEPVFVAMLVSVAKFLLPAVMGTCLTKPPDHDNYPFQSTLQAFYCGKDQYNEMATFFFNPAEMAIKQLFHFEGVDAFSNMNLAIFWLVYTLFTAITYGIAVPSGLFVPSLLAGASFGRLVGQGMGIWLPGRVVFPGTYALVGAAAMLGGMARMTISLAVILLESTGAIRFGLPVMVALMAAQWTGNIFNHGLYDIHIDLKHWPILEHKPPKVIHKLRAHDVMTAHPQTIELVAKAGEIHDMLQVRPHHDGFPVVYPSFILQANPRMGNLAGLILRKQLCIILDKRKAFRREKPIPKLAVVPGCHDQPMLSHTETPHDADILSWEDMEGSFPRYPSADRILLTAAEREMWVDLRPYLHPTPYTLKEKAAVAQVFRLFRGMGLRHVLVTDEQDDVQGIICRHNLTPMALEWAWHKFAHSQVRTPSSDPHMKRPGFSTGDGHMAASYAFPAASASLQ